MQPSVRRIVYGLVLLAGLAWMAFSAERDEAAAAGERHAPQAGFLAPDFALAAPDGTLFTLSEFRGQAVLVNLWATWCEPCRAEMPSIDKMYLEYRDQGFVVIGVNSTAEDDPRVVGDYVRELGLSFPIVLDVAGQVSRSYELRVLPTSFFIDRQGVIREVIVGGPMPEALLRADIEELLK